MKTYGCSATVKHWTMSNVLNVHLYIGYGPNSCAQSKSSPINRLINDRLSVS